MKFINLLIILAISLFSATAFACGNVSVSYHMPWMKAGIILFAAYPFVFVLYVLLKKERSSLARPAALIMSFGLTSLCWQMLATENAYASWDQPAAWLAVSCGVSICTLIMAELADKIPRARILSFIVIAFLSFSGAIFFFAQARSVAGFLEPSEAVMKEVTF